MGQQLARDGHGEVSHVGEVGQALLTWRVVLPEDHLALRSMQRLPLPDTPLQRAADARRQIRMAAKHLLEHGDGPQAGHGYQHRDDLRLPDRGQRVGTAAAANCLSLRGQLWIGIEPCAGAGADTGSRCGELARLGPTKVQVESRLLVGDVRAGHGQSSGREPLQSGTTSRRHRQASKRPTLPGMSYDRLRQPPVTPGNHHPD